MSAVRSQAVADPVVVPAGTTCADAVAAAGLPAAGPRAVVVVRDPAGALRDLSWAPEADTEVVPVPLDSPDGLTVLRHSTAHVLAQAMQDLFPQAKLGIGPPVENGFYYDFDVPPLHPQDVEKLEQRMAEIVRSGQLFRRRRFADLAQARAELADEPYKLELIEVKGGDTKGGDTKGGDTKGGDAKGGGFDDSEVMEVGGTELTIYDNLDPQTGKVCWSDLCRGPHLPSTRLIDPRAFKLMRTAAAYWRGSEANPQLQRVYGTAWPTRDALKAYLKMREEAARRDHRRLGAELDLFSFPDQIGSGLAVFHPKGGVVRKAMEDYSRRRHEESGYEFVYSPHITKSALFETSGHLDWYAEGMFPPMHLDAELDAEGKVRKPGQDYYLKPMNCPFHNLIYSARGRSYRELPLRLFEFGGVYRYEKSGVVHGLTRVRGFTQDDAHIYCTPEQLQDELASLLEFVLGLLRDYGLTEFEAELSTRPVKFVGTPEEWDTAEAALEEALRRAGLPYRIGEGEGTFYAPKIDVHCRDAIGRSWQLSTLQVDFQLPVRFDLEYQDADGIRRRPYMIHRALFGSIERFFGILTEHYAGAFPAWLAPVQVVGIPIRDEHVPYLDDFVARLRAGGIRAEVDASTERMQKKIRTAQQQKVPFMAIVGDQDAADGTVSFRYRDGSQRNGVPLDQAVAHVAEVVRSRTNTGPSASASG